MKKFSEGESVYMCYDSKFGRAMEGTIISVGPGEVPEYYKVKFVPWLSDDGLPVEIMCFPNERNFYGGWLTGNGELGILRRLGCQGDWYSLVKKHVIDEEFNDENW